MLQSPRLKLASRLRSPLCWLAVWYLVISCIYASVTPFAEKPDEHGHYGHVLYLRQYRTLAPLVPLNARSSVEFKQADLASTRSVLAWELHQAPLYYVMAALLTSWLPDDPDPDQFFDRNPQFKYAAPVLRNDNRNNWLHPPDMTPLLLGTRLVSLLFGLGTMLAAYYLALQLFPKNSLVPIATAAIVGFHPTFLFISTAASNDAATAFFGTLTVAILVRRLQKGQFAGFAVQLGIVLGLASLTKVSALVFLPLVGLALIIIHRGFRWRLIQDGFIILVIALLVGSWWYARNTILYHDPLLMSAHPTPGPGTLSWNQIKYYALTMEYTFWADQNLTFVQPILFDQALIWWGRASLLLLAVGLVVNRRLTRARWATWLLLLSWAVTFVILLIFYWSPQTIIPYGRLLFPAISPLILLFVFGWHALFPGRGGRRILTVLAGAVVIMGSTIPFVTLYPLFHPSREWNARQVEHPVGIVYADPATGNPVARLIGYNLPKPYASPGDYYLIELCWEPLGQTEVPFSVFVQLLDVGQIQDGSPTAWGRRETFPGLGNRPTDRWTLHQAFCDPVYVQVFPETPTPTGVAIEVGFTEPQRGHLQPIDSQGDPIDLAVAGRVPILSSKDVGTAIQPARYVLGDAIGLDNAQVAQSPDSSVTLTLTWQTIRPMTEDATLFVHLRTADGTVLAQADRQPLDGHLPTSLWLPGQVVTDVINLPLPPGANEMLLVLDIGMYLWPSMERLPVKGASGENMRDNVIAIEMPRAH